MKLETAGCSVNRDGTDWHRAGDMTPPEVNTDSAPVLREGNASRSKETEAILLADLISELEDNLEKARGPRIGDTYQKPSLEVWKRNRNRLTLPADLRPDIETTYRQIEGWRSVVDSGLHPNYGSQALNVATSSLIVRLPGLIDSLRKLLG